jgi:hypothetical protein
MFNKKFNNKPATTISPVFQTSFQMFQVTDPYYYGQAAEDGYTDFEGGGKMKSGNPGDIVGLGNDLLLGYRPTYLRNNTPYDQNVTLLYEQSYQNIPRKDATSVFTLTGFQITNSAKNINSVINYSVSITSVDRSQSVKTTGGAAPGQTVSLQLPPGLNTYNGNGGFDVSIRASTLCNGPCETNENALVFQGYTRFNFNP